MANEPQDCQGCPSKQAGGCGGACPSQGEKEPTLAQQHSNIKHVLVVMSGKGGVGKSSFSSLLAIALHKKGYRVGLMDADITGPSIPKLFGASGRPNYGEFGAEPILSKQGIKLMSMNFLLPNEDDPVVWRGPVMAGVIKEFWENVYWGELDFLIVDMPPGTGDVPLTVLQTLPVDGALIVTTPQSLSNMVVRKGIKMLELMQIPVLGLVENMAYVLCPGCDDKPYYLFGEGNTAHTAEQHKVAFINAFPLDPDVAKLGDKGELEAYDGVVLDTMLASVEKIIAPLM